MEDREILKDLDQRFVDIYEATRSALVERQKEIALIVIDDDDLMLYRHDHPMERFTGLRPPRYDKMKTLGHLVLGVYCIVRDQTGEPLSGTRLAQITSYRDAIKAAAGALDTANETATSILPEPSPVYDMVSSFLDAAVDARTVLKDELETFAATVDPHIGPVLAAAAHAQIDACNSIMEQIRESRLTKEEWSNLRVLVLGPYMARQGQLLLQYFSELLHTPAQSDRRVVYFDGTDLAEALDRLGTTMLDAEASQAIFGDHNRLHRDVLADSTKVYLKTLARIGGG